MPMGTYLRETFEIGFILLILQYLSIIALLLLSDAILLPCRLMCYAEGQALDQDDDRCYARCFYGAFILILSSAIGLVDLRAGD